MYKLLIFIFLFSGCFPAFENAIIELKEKGCEIHTRSTFLQGLFFMDPKKLESFFDDIKPILSQLQKIVPLNGSLLKFVLDKQFIEIISMRNKTNRLEQLFLSRLRNNGND